MSPIMSPAPEIAPVVPERLAVVAEPSAGAEIDSATIGDTAGIRVLLRTSEK